MLVNSGMELNDSGEDRLFNCTDYECIYLENLSLGLTSTATEKAKNHILPTVYICTSRRRDRKSKRYCRLECVLDSTVQHINVHKSFLLFPK